MAKVTDQNTDNTCFHGVLFRASVDQLIAAYGEPSMENNTGNDKVNFEWEMVTSKGDVFTIYDWKYYRSLRNDEMIEWHIGAHSKSVSYDAEVEVIKDLKNS